MSRKEDRNQGGFVETVKSADGSGTDTVIVTGDGVHTHHCPGGITEDEMED